ncbi:hypothetical protein MRX96_052132 [Rhipicephalus microplus]
MASSLRDSFSPQSPNVKSPPCSSALELAVQRAPGDDGFGGTAARARGVQAAVRLSRTDDDRLLGAIHAFPCLEDERLRVWRRFLPRFERRLMVEEDVMDRTWRWLLVRLFRDWLASDDAEELLRPRALRVGPTWLLCDECLDRPRLTFLDERRFGPPLAVSFGLFEEELRERFVRRILGALAATSLLVEGFSPSGCITSVALRNFRAGVGAMGVGASEPSAEVFGGRPRRRLVAAASLEEAAAF